MDKLRNRNPNFSLGSIANSKKHSNPLAQAKIVKKQRTDLPEKSILEFLDEENVHEIDVQVYLKLSVLYN